MARHRQAVLARRHTRYLIWAAALAAAPGWWIAAQAFEPTAGFSRGIAVGTKVRVWGEPELTLKLLPMRFGMHAERIVGTVLQPPGEDRLKVRRTALILAPWESRYRTFFWTTTQRVDVADGTYGAAGIVPGTVDGLLSALFVSALYTLPTKLFCAIWGGSSSECGPGFWHVFGVSAAVLVPVGVVIHVRATRWRRVY